MTEMSGAPSARSLAMSAVFHAVVLLLLVMISAGALHRPPRSKELEVVFHHARPKVDVPVRTALPVGVKELPAAGPRMDRVAKPGPSIPSRESGPSAPEAPGNPNLEPGPAGGAAVAEVSPKEKVGNSGILAFKDKFASLSRDKVTPKLGADARYSAADEVGKTSARSSLTTSAQGSSGGINVASLNRSVGGGGGGGIGGGPGGGAGGPGGAGGGGAGGGGVGVGRATSPIAAIGGADRPKSRSGPGSSRTDEEIQIVFDRYKASFYRLYNRELRNNPTLQGQVVLRLTIEPDGSVSMCELKSTNMDSPDLVAQVVSRVKTINFGAKEGVLALTIVYPIDFLPAA